MLKTFLQTSRQLLAEIVTSRQTVRRIKIGACFGLKILFSKVKPENDNGPISRSIRCAPDVHWFSDFRSGYLMRSDWITTRWQLLREQCMSACIRPSELKRGW